MTDTTESSAIDEPEESRVPVLDAAAFWVRAACARYDFREALSDVHLDGGFALAADGVRVLRCHLKTIATTEPSALYYQRVSLPFSKRLRRALKDNAHLRIEAFREPRVQAHGLALSDPAAMARGSDDEILYPIAIHAPEDGDRGLPFAVAHTTIEQANTPGEARVWVNPALLSELLDAFTKAIVATGGPSDKGVQLTVHGPNQAIGLSATLCDGRVMDGAMMPLAAAESETPA